jgi:hypothetical protein
MIVTYRSRFNISNPEGDVVVQSMPVAVGQWNNFFESLALRHDKDPITVLKVYCCNLAYGVFQSALQTFIESNQLKAIERLKEDLRGGAVNVEIFIEAGAQKALNTVDVRCDKSTNIAGECVIALEGSTLVGFEVEMQKSLLGGLRDTTQVNLNSMSHAETLRKGARQLSGLSRKPIVLNIQGHNIWCFQNLIRLNALLSDDTVTRDKSRLAHIVHSLVRRNSVTEVSITST